MKQLITFIRKEFLHVFRDRKTLLLLFGLPIVQITLFGFALSNEIKNTHIAICDYARDQDTRRITEKIEASRNFEIERSLLGPEAIEEAFKSGKIKMAIVFPVNFGEDLGHFQKASIQLIADASDPNTANTLMSYASNIINAYQQEKAGAAAMPYQIRLETRMIYNPGLSGTTNFVPGVMALVLLLICVLMTSVSIVREKELGTMEILLVSPFHPFLVIIAKVFPYFILSLVNLTIILVMSIFVLHMPVNGSIPLLFAESALLITTALSLGLLISNVTASQQAAMLISLMGMMLPTVLLTGFMFPLENMPWPLQAVSHIVPSRWYYIIVKDIMIKGLGFSAIWKESLILFGMTVFLIIVSVKRFKIRLA